jgi:hypothetical protein
MVSRCLVEAFAKNSELKGFEDIVPTTLHEYADVFSETTFDSLPKHHKWNHAIELEQEPSSTKIEYLGIIISHNKEKMDPVKIAGVADWPIPSNKKEVQSFIDFINFYQCFIPGFSHHACTLFDLTMKDIRFIWGLPQEDSFMKLKGPITSAPVLVLPNDDLPFRLEADGSIIATGVILLQQNVDDNVWHPVTFLSKALNPVEWNYEIHDTEMLAII